MNVPLVKVGVSFSKVMYEDNESELYFSPSDLLTGEAFFEASNLYSTKGKFTYKIFTAIGRQKIEDQELQLTRRVELLCGYQIMNDINLQAYFNNSNAAQANAIGFSFTNYGLRIGMKL